MNILVCIKQVPDTTIIKIDPVTNTLMREGVPAIVSPFDAYALEAAARIKDKYKDTKIYVLSMGPEQALAALKECLSVGGDKAYLVSDRACGGSDTLATGYILSKAKEKIEELEGIKFETVDFFSYNETLKGVAVAPLMNHIFKYSDKGVGGRAGSKVAVESARYDVLASLATFLGRKEVIPIGSMIAIEIWQDKTAQPLPPQYIIRFVLNGNEVLLEETADKFRFDTLPAIDGFCPYQNVYNY